MGVAEKRLRLLLDMARRVTSSMDLSEVMRNVIREVLDLLQMDRGVLLLDRGGRRLETQAVGRRDSDTFSDEELKISSSLLEQARHSTQLLALVNLKQSPRAKDTGSLIGRGSVVVVPLFHQDRFIGALYLDSAREIATLGPEERAFMEAVGQVAALSLAGVRTHTRILEAARINEDIGTTLHLREVLDRTLGRIVEITCADQGFLLVRDEEGADLQIWGGRDRSGQPILTTGQKAISWRVVQRVVSSGNAVLSDNVQEESDFGQGGSIAQFGLTSILCVPIKTKRGVMGAVYLENQALEAAFNDEDQRLVQLMADHAGMAIENARLYGQAREMVNSLANAVEARDLGTSNHVQRVSRYSVAVGKRLGLRDDQLADLEQSAILHDIGKIGIPDKILLKPGGLNQEEWNTMRTHPQQGIRIVRPVQLPREVRAGILCHHEAMDGSGYPQGLVGEAIPLYARIIAVADAYDAMVEDRAYRRGMPRGAAVGELQRCSGARFDKRVVDTFLQVLAEEESGTPHPEAKAP
jgi:GAF domain-containing protein